MPERPPAPNPDGRVQGHRQPVFLLTDIGQLRQAEQVVTKGKVVAIYYMLKVNGILRHGRSPLWNDPPLEYLHGSGQIIPGWRRPWRAGWKGPAPCWCSAHIPPPGWR